MVSKNLVINTRFIVNRIDTANAINNYQYLVPEYMTAYAIVQINITNPEDYKEYLKQVTPIVEKYGGEYIIRGGKFEIMLGTWNYERTVVVKFPSYDVAINWYHSDEYAPVRKIREDNSEGNLIIVEGKKKTT